MLLRDLLAGPELQELGTRLPQSAAVRSPTVDVGVNVVLAVILPEADRADLEPTSLPEGEVPAARAWFAVSLHHLVFPTSWAAKPSPRWLSADSELYSPANPRAILIGNSPAASPSHFVPVL